MGSLAPYGDRAGDLAQAIEKILEKGLVLNADIAVSVCGTELLGIKIRAALASFETAARYGLEFPSGINLGAPAWRDLDKAKARCPQCRNLREERELIERGCPICGWMAPLRARTSFSRRSV